MIPPTLAMFLRYAVAIGISFAVAKGWFSDAMGGEVSKIVEVILGALAAFAPAVYAAVKIDNSPKT